MNIYELRDQVERVSAEMNRLTIVVTALAEILGVDEDELQDPATLLSRRVSMQAPASAPPAGTVGGWWCLDGKVPSRHPTDVSGRVLSVPESVLRLDLPLEPLAVGDTATILTQTKAGTWEPLPRRVLTSRTFGDRLLAGEALMFVVYPWPTVLTLRVTRVSYDNATGPIEWRSNDPVCVIIEHLEPPP